jgi:hypothetical protein
MTEKDAIPPDYLADMLWAREHTQELHDRYESKWVAVVGQEVVAAGRNRGSVRKLAARKTGRSPDGIYVDYMEDGLAIYAQDPPALRDSTPSPDESV